MPLEDILKRIEEEAASKKALILDKARREAALRKEKAQEELKKETEALIERKREEAQREAQRLLAEARLWGRNELNRVRQEALKTLRKELERRLLEATQEEALEWWKGVLQRAVESGEEEVWMFPREAEKLGSRFVEEVNRSLGYRLSFGGVLEDTTRHGFLLKKGGMIIDVSLETLLEDFFHRNEREIQEALFQGVES